MTRYLVLQTNKKEIIVALIYRKNISEVYFHYNNSNPLIGDIYLGIIKNIDENLKAAFVNIGEVKDAFLHYYELGLQFKCLLNFLSIKSFNYLLKVFFYLEKLQINWICNLKNPLKNNTKILVQITRESISNKGPKLTTEISLPGRFFILIPFIETLYIYQGIRDFNKKKLFTFLLKNITPSGFGIIVRKKALNKNNYFLKLDLIYLTKKWRNLLKKIKINNLPSKLMKNIDTFYCILRYLYSVTSIICDNQDLCEEISNYLYINKLNRYDIIRYYCDNIIPIFEKFGIEKYMKTSLGKYIPLIYGAYLVIDHTEGLHVIDVNTGTVDEIYQKKKITINLIAATEISRQLKLRDIGGIIVIDFIDMRELDQNNILYDHFKNMLKNDQAKYKILPISRFGLIQLTREKVRHEFHLKNEEKKPNNYKSKIFESPIEHIYRIESILQTKIIKNCILHTHPFIAAYLKEGFPSLQQIWFIKFKKWARIISRYSFKYLEYQILDTNNNIIFLYNN